jgi:hypothetical protein
MGTKKTDLVFARRRRPWLPAALAVLLLAAPAGLFAARHGATLRLDLLDGRRLQGELLAVKGETLLLLSDSGSEAQAAIGEVAVMRIVRPNRVGKGLVSGLLTGFAVGCLVGLTAGLDDDEGYTLLWMGIAGSVFGSAGAVVGAGAGLISSSDETIDCRKRDAARRSALLERLQRLARFRDFRVEEPANGPGLERPLTAPAVPSAPPKEEFARWRLGATFLQLPRGYEQRALDLSGSFRYPEPISAAGRQSSRTYDEEGIRRWARVSDIRLEYFLSRRWAVGILLDPFAREKNLFGDKALRFAGKELPTWWNMKISSHSYFLTAAYSLVAADGFLRQTALRLRAGLGWNRSGFDYYESASAWSYDGDPEFPIKYYSASANKWPESSLSALVEGEAAQYVNSRWSLALNAGFRYLPLRVRDQEMIGTITRRPPLSDLACSVAIPGSTLNLGGFYLGVTLGFHL